MYEYITKNNNNDKNIQIYHNKKSNEYIPLANISEYYGPDYRQLIDNSSIIQNNIITSKDYLLQFYIGTISFLGIIVLYKFFEKS